MLLVSVAAGLAATVLAFLYIDSATSQVTEIEPAQTVEVLYTIADLSTDQPIDAAVDLRVESVNVDDSPGLARNAVKASERSAVDGRPISVPVPAGSPLMYSYLTPVKDVELTTGMRALAISVSNENLMGGLLVPGDRVDILVSYELILEPEPVETPAEDTGGGGAADDPTAAITNMMTQMMGSLGGAAAAGTTEWVTDEVLSDVRVIAVGSSLTGSRQAQMFGLSSSSRGSTITIEISTEDAKELIRSQANGRNPLTLLLRPEDTSTEGGNRVLGS